MNPSDEQFFENPDYYLDAEAELNFNDEPVQPEDAYRYSDTLTLSDDS